MKQVELLSPAGSYESAIAAIQNGCNAIYMAGNKFGARAFASNFDDSKIKEIIKYAHAYGVKVYITLNTLIHDEECDSCFKYIKFLYEANVDALILQDLGILAYVRENYSDFEVHASTQMHIVNKSALLFLKEMGVTRAVLAREVSIQEIKMFAKCKIDLEVFVNGALCVAYSGQCLMSSMIGGRSGNRGECAQTCRMPYTLCNYESKKEFKEQAYLLSLKDLFTLDHMEELMRSGITSFKIEGRMKKSEYVGYITSLYRKKMDEIHYTFSDNEIKNAKLLFNRGFTSGFLYTQKGSQLYNPIRPNHIGIEIGRVQRYVNHRIQVKLSDTLDQGDGIRILDHQKDYGFMVNRLYVNGLLANHAEANVLVEIECHEVVKKGSVIVKTSAKNLEKQIRTTYDHSNRRVHINMSFIANKEETLLLRITHEAHSIEVRSEQLIELANQKATSKDDIIKQLSKVNDTIYALDHVEVCMSDELFIPIKVINQLRRDGLNKLYELESNVMNRVNHPFVLKKSEMIHREIQWNAKVINEKQLLACIDLVDTVYVEDKVLYHLYKGNDKVKLCSERVEKEMYQEVTLIQEIGGIHELSNFECDYSLNVYNAYTCHFLHQLGATLISLSHELKSDEIYTLMKTYQKKYQSIPNVQVSIYGRVEVMVSEHCPINASLLDNDKKNCTLCRNQTYALKDKFNNYFPMCNDTHCRMHLYDYKIRNRFDEIHKLLDCGVVGLRFDFTFEDENEVRRIIENAKKVKNSTENSKV